VCAFCVILVRFFPFWQEEDYLGNNSVNITQVKLKLGENVDGIIINWFAYLLWAVALLFECNFNPMFPEIHYSQNFSPFSGWMGPKFGQKMATHYIYPTYNLNHPNAMSVARETAGSVNFDGPSFPSQNCSSSCTSTTHAIGLVLVHTSPNNIVLRCLSEIYRHDFGVLPKWQGKTPKWHNRRLFSWIGPLPPMWEGGDTLGTL